MYPFRQEIRFVRTADDAQVAYAACGNGYPLVRAAHWLTHIEFDVDTPVWRPWIERLGARFRYYRYDARGCGLSGPNSDPTTLDRLVADLEAVVDAARLERFALFGMSQGGAAAIAYAARHPERISHLILCGAFVQGALKRNPTPQQVASVEAMIKLVEVGWGEKNSAFVQMFTSQFFPDASLEQMQSFNELQRRSTSPANAARIIRGFSEIDATDAMAQVTAPTLVMHCRGDTRAPFEQGCLIAATIPGARFEPLASNNHFPLAGEPAFSVALDAVERFVGSGGPAPFMDLTAREREVLELVARGLDNLQISAHLGLSEKTVRNNITRILDKMAVENRSQAIVRARNAGFGAG